MARKIINCTGAKLIWDMREMHVDLLIYIYKKNKRSE